MKKLLAHILFFALVLTSCEVNELPDDNISESSFFVEGTLNGEEFNLLAGPDNVVVNPESSLITEEYPEFFTEFTSFGCEECLESLELTIIGAEEFTSSSTLSDLLPLDLYEIIVPDYQDPSNNEYAINVSNSNGGTLSIVNTTTSQQVNVNDQFIFEPEEGGGLYNLEWVSEEGGSLTCIYNSNFIVNEFNEICYSPAAVSMANGVLSLTLTNPNSIAIITGSDGSDIVEFSESFSINFDDFFTVGDEFLSLVIQNLDGTECTIFESYTWFNIAEVCLPEIQFNETNNADEEFPQSVSMKYTNESGEEFSSTFGGVDDWFSINQIEIFDQSSDMSNLFSIHISFSLTLHSETISGNSILLESSNAIIPLVFE